MISRGETQGSRRLTFLVWHMNVVILSIRFHGACQCECLASILISKASHVEFPHIPFGMTVNDPFCHYFTDAARAGDAVRTERACHPETTHRRWAEKIF